MFFEHVTCKHGVLDSIITDHATQFTSRFWTRVCSHLSINHRLSTAFHPQTNGQTERQNQTMEKYLRAFCICEQDNWVELLPLAEFAYNNSMHASMRMTPFWAFFHRNYQMRFKAPKPPASHLESEIPADAVLEGLQETHRVLRENLLEAPKRQSLYAGGKEITFKVGDKVWLSMEHLRTTRPSKKLDYKRTGQYMVSKIINKNASKLDLPNTMRNHNVFHVSLLDRYAPPVAGQPPSEPQSTIVDDAGEQEWEVERILDAKLRDLKVHYFVQWAGYSHVRTSWEPAENLENANDLVDNFHLTLPEKPRRK